jgi:uncharacterized membrane protein
MPERRFTARALIRRDRQAVFDWVADHRNLPRVLDGITRWEPTGLQTQGVGARFQVEMHALGFPLVNELVIETWEPPRVIEWGSASGVVRQRGGWRFEEHPEGTMTTLTIAYTPPGGLAGNLVAGRVDHLVRDRLERALNRMKDLIEAPEFG